MQSAVKGNLGTTNTNSINQIFGIKVETVIISMGLEFSFQANFLSLKRRHGQNSEAG